jgi:hypothetical protein
MMVRFRVGGALLLLATLTLFGCKSYNPNAPARVSGRVYYNSNPVTGGMLTFHTKDGSQIPVGIAPDGTYTAYDIPDGDMVVTIDTESLNPNKKQEDYRGNSKSKYGMKGGAQHDTAAPKEPIPEGAAGHEGKYVKIPDKYRDPAKSDLKCTLKKGEQKQDFSLTD